MTLLAELIKKRESRAIATAIPAIPAIPSTKIAKIAKIARVNPKVVQSDGVANSGGKVANVAKVAVVNLQTDPKPTKAEKLLELDSLIQYIAVANDFSGYDIEEAKYNANKDIENALISFRALARDIRRDKVMEMLIASPGSLRAVYTDAFSNPNNVILAIAVRNGVVAEMLIPRSKYYPFKLMSVLDGEVH